ncbi:MAG: hypothetical protein AVDCRST_MAG93-8674 [uncultured Chloroflexia bacterium]|uniref:Laminin IV type A domain-containing protein n=1 Tax=uncultured Chloroflexia bacterium TaxID=1672391 RepID=A0A6J4N0R3_9CHLR|nr:MAG: hypothetical protein AVDCRST_MAG93-8674 [uncultured Chloroflexia bacterium]
MRLLTTIFMLGLLISASVAPWSRSSVHAQQTPPPVAVSTFDTGAEGWTTDGDAICRPTPCYASTGGNPGGHIYTNDSLQGVKFYFNAPPKFLGNASAAYQKNLTFDMRQDARGTQETNDLDVILEGAGLHLVFDTPRNPPRLWFSYNVSLDETAGWHKDTLAGPQPTADEMQAVLGSLTRLSIRGDYIFGQATTYLDNVVLGGSLVPEDEAYEIFLPLVRMR